MSAVQDALFTPRDYFREIPISEIFGRHDVPLELDLGCGDGSFLIDLAAHHPERNFLGVERLAGRVEKTAKRIRQAGLSNARVLRLDTTYVVAWLLPASSASRVHLLCPDPWPKKKHEGRQIFKNAEFLNGVARVLRSGGEFLLKTDDRPYYHNALESMAVQPAFERQIWPAEAFFYPRTDFEIQWTELGKTLECARWRRV